MATRIVSWSNNEHTISPSLLKTPSMVSFDSVLSDNSETPSMQGARNAVESRIKYVTSQVKEPSGTRTYTSASMSPGVGATDGSFVRHHRYFFKDGNVTFLVDNTLYCVHRYFFSRDSIYFSIRFTQLGTRDHEALPTIISLGDIESKDFDAFLSVLYPEVFDKNDLCYEEWKSVLNLSTRWGFSSIRKLALSYIEPPTPHDRLLLARAYSVGDWVVPALSALCERTTPLTLLEARQMNIEDVVLVSTVREHIRGPTIQVDAAEIPLCVEAKQLVALGHPVPPSSLRESEDGTPLAGAWHPRFRWEKAEAEARAKAQEATRLRLDAEAKERAEAGNKAPHEAEAEKARLFVETVRGDVEKARLRAEKARKDVKETARWVTEMVRREEDQKARREAEKACIDEEEKTRLEVEETKRKDAEDKARAKKAKKAAGAAEKKRKADAKVEADTKAQSAEAEKMKREVEAKATKEILEAEARAEEARIKANEDAGNKAKAEEEVKAKEAADREAEARAIADAETKAAVKKAKQEAATRAATAKAEAAAAEEVKREKKRRRMEKLRKAAAAELRAKEAAEQVAKQRAADRAQKRAMLTSSSPASGPISSKTSEGGWLFGKTSQPVSAIATPGQTDEPRPPAATSSSDLFSGIHIRNLSENECACKLEPISFSTPPYIAHVTRLNPPPLTPKSRSRHTSASTLVAGDTQIAPPSPTDLTSTKAVIPRHAQHARPLAGRVLVQNYVLLDMHLIVYELV